MPGVRACVCVRVHTRIRQSTVRGAVVQNLASGIRQTASNPAVPWTSHASSMILILIH